MAKARDTALTKQARTRLNPQEREREIIEGAALYFSEVGFDGSMRDLAGRLGISHALLFRYFPTKEDLVDRVYDRIFLSAWDPEWDTLLNDHTMSLSLRLTGFYARYLASIDNPVWVRTFIYAGLAGFNINKRYLQMIRRKVIEPVARELNRGAKGDDAHPLADVAVELSLALHGEIFYFAIRRWVYGVKVEGDVDTFVALTVVKFLEGAPAALRVSKKYRRETRAASAAPRNLER